VPSLVDPVLPTLGWCLQALHVLDRFHITMHLNHAVDQVRRAEVGRLQGRSVAEKLKHMRWKLLR